MNWKELFYKPLKIKGDSNNILLWGCIHAHHDPVHWESPIWHRRGYKSALDHAEGLVKKWNEKANNETIGFLLGDTMFGQGGADKFINLLEQLSFKNLYICGGNHFSGFHQTFKLCKENVYYLEDKSVIFCPNYFEAFINGQAVALGHYPILSWNGQAKGSIHFFSHVHGSLDESQLGRDYLKQCKCIEVSVEKNPYPISFAESLELVKDKPNFAPDHHTSDIHNPF